MAVFFSKRHSERGVGKKGLPFAWHRKELAHYSTLLHRSLENFEIKHIREHIGTYDLCVIPLLHIYQLRDHHALVFVLINSSMYLSNSSVR